MLASPQVVRVPSVPYQLRELPTPPPSLHLDARNPLLIVRRQNVVVAALRAVEDCYDITRVKGFDWAARRSRVWSQRSRCADGRRLIDHILLGVANRRHPGKEPDKINDSSHALSPTVLPEVLRWATMVHEMNLKCNSKISSPRGATD